MTQYDAVISHDPRFILADPQIEIESVLSFGGVQESSSVLIGTTTAGLWTTTTSPSKQFDILSPDFNKFQLIITISVLSLITFTTNRMVSTLTTQTTVAARSRSFDRLSLVQVRNRQVSQKWYSSS